MSFQVISRRLVAAALLSLAASWPAAAQGDSARLGRWAEPIRWPIIGIHAAVLPTGEVFHLSYVEVESYRGTVATLWNPATGKFRDVTPGFGNMFCSGQNFLADGRLFAAGGIDPQRCEVQGTRETYLFDPFRAEWQEAGKMRVARYYPTVLTLPDGRELIIAGQGSNCQYVPTMEVFDPEKGIQRVRGPNRIMRDYPRAFLLSTGELAQVAPESATALLDEKMRAWTGVAVTRLGRIRYEATAFYLPGRRDQIMLCGGYLERSATLELYAPTARCEVIDFTQSPPLWREAAPMNEARGDANSVILPDGKVLVVGGGAHHRYEGPVRYPEIYDPETNRWTLVTGQRFGRMYHSTAVLLPDGRVLSAGQDNEQGVVSGAWGEIYSPPYLFRGKRPKIRRAPAAVAWGEPFDLKVKRAQRVEKVVLIGLSAVTHATNVGQRYVPLEIESSVKKVIRARMERSPNLAPPGHYLLFAVDGKGVPSVAAIVRVGEGAAG